MPTKICHILDTFHIPVLQYLQCFGNVYQLKFVIFCILCILWMFKPAQVLFQRNLFSDTVWRETGDCWAVEKHLLLWANIKKSAQRFQCFVFSSVEFLYDEGQCLTFELGFCDFELTIIMHNMQHWLGYSPLWMRLALVGLT